MTSNFKPHQFNILLIVIGIFLGGAIYHFISSRTVEGIKDRAYQKGYEDGELMTTQILIDNFSWADSIAVKKDTIEFYNSEFEQITFK